MTRTERVRAFLQAVEARQWEAAAAHLADTFIVSDRGPSGHTIDRATFLREGRAALDAVPDWRFNLHVAREQGNIVWGSIHITGTLRGMPLALPAMGVRFTFNGDLIAVMSMEPRTDAHLRANAESPLVASSGLPHRRPRPSVAEAVHAATFPVYGLDGSPLGLSTRGYGSGYSSAAQPAPAVEGPPHITSCQFIYTSPARTATPERTLTVSTSDPHAPYLPPPEEAGINWSTYPEESALHDEDARRYTRFATLADLRAAPEAAPPFLVDALPIGETVYAARMQFWQQPPAEWQAHLRGAASHLYVTASGVSRADLLDLLEHLVPVNERPDLIARYAEETAEALRSFRDQAHGSAPE